jgi:5-methylcytosine-specific restriction endonuclease McrA
MKKSKTNLLQKALREKRLATGCCSSCNDPRHENTTYCIVHLQKRRRWESVRRKIRVSSGGCGSCATGIPIGDTVLCLKCWWSIKASTFGSTALIQPLQELWRKQDGKCALSGLSLTVGENASIDHIMPKSKGGSNKIENLRWLHTSVNSGKGILSDEQFIEVCKAVAVHNQ